MITTKQSIFDHQGSHIQIDNHPISIIAKIEEPMIIVLDGVLTNEECDQLVHISRDRLQRSKIGNTHTTSDLRTSTGSFLEENESPWISNLEQRISSLMNIPIQNAEPLHVLNYQPGQEYKPHLDYFSSPDVINNRISTLILYLNDVEEGGETFFPHLHFSVLPKKGRAVYFEYFYKDDLLNQLTLHAGKPVIQGEKWVATQWMRRQQYRI